MKRLLKHAKKKSTLLRSLKIAVIVGTALALINHYDAIISGTLSSKNIAQILLTYVVPFSVAVFSSASHGRQIELGE